LPYYPLSFGGDEIAIKTGARKAAPLLTIDELLKQLRTEGQHETYSPAPIGEVEKTEAAIGHPLPESYRQFVTQYSNGAYLFELQEVSAVGGGNTQIMAIQDITREGESDETIPFRDGGETRYGNLIPFGLDANGNEWSFVVEPGRPENEYDVAYLDTSGRKLYGKLSGFSDWLSVVIREQDEVIWALYDEDVLSDELMLG
jgi:hypothetical protein